MLSNLFSQLGRVFYLVPVNYWYGLAGVATVAILAGIGNTVFNQPEIPMEEIRAKEVASAKAVRIAARKAIPMPNSISEGNIFRKERRDYRSPQKEGKPAEGDTIPEIKLLGTIITGDKRVAILDGKVKKYIKKKIGPRPGLSGARYFEMEARGLNYQLILVGEEDLEGQSFYEGAMISGYILERVLEDRIEVVHLASGRKTQVFLDTEEHQRRMAEQLLRAPDATTLISDFHLSGIRKSK